MSEQVQQRSAKKVKEAPQAVPPAAADNHQKLKDDLDAVLDTIDEALVENADEFVRAFVQKGGE